MKTAIAMNNNNNKKNSFKGKDLFFLIAGIMMISVVTASTSVPPKKEIYGILVYHFKDAAQESRLDAYLKNAFIPAAHKEGFAKVGVFKPVGNDTSSDRRIFVFFAGRSAGQILNLPGKLAAGSDYVTAAADYINASWDKPIYTRLETILTEAFDGKPKME